MKIQSCSFVHYSEFGLDEGAWEAMEESEVFGFVRSQTEGIHSLVPIKAICDYLIDNGTDEEFRKVDDVRKDHPNLFIDVENY